MLLIAQRAARKRAHTPTDLYLLLAIAWSVSVGYGVIVSMASGDWVAATLACLSSAAMVGGICFRNFSAPRLAAAMILHQAWAHVFPVPRSVVSLCFMSCCCKLRSISTP